MIIRAEVRKRNRAPRLRYTAAAGVLGLTVLTVVAHPISVSAAAMETVSSCADSGSGSLRAAVANAAAGSTIVFDSSLPCSTITLTSGAIPISTNLTVTGPGASDLALSGGGSVQDFVVAAGVTASISGLTIEDGIAADGGGVLNNGTLTISACTLSGNTAQNLGGAIANAGTLTVTDSAVTDNTVNSGGGGGLATLSGASTDVTDSTLSDNTAVDEGGALFSIGSVNGSETGTLTVENSTLSDNTAQVYGGAISSGGTLWVIRSTLSGNESGDRGGGIETYGADNVLIAGSTLTGNTASFGGGLENENSSTTVVTSTFSGNTGGDITVQGGTLNLQATIVANAVAGTDCSGTISDHSENLVDDGSCGLQGLVDDFPDSPAGLDPRGLEDNGGPTETIALEPDSPAIGSVPTAVVCASPDQRGVTRSTPCDIGAVDAVVMAQTITFSSIAPSSASVGGPPYEVAAAASSGLPVTLSIDGTASSVCSLAGSTVSFMGTGTCIIDANQAGYGSFDPAPQVQESFSVGPAADTFTSADHATVVAGEAFSFTITTVGALSISKKGELPRHHHFVDNGDGTATLSGTLKKAGTYPLTIEAQFGKGKTKKVVTQLFTLTVDPARSPTGVVSANYPIDVA